MEKDVNASPIRRCVRERDRLQTLRKSYPSLPANFMRSSDADIAAHYKASNPPSISLSYTSRCSTVFGGISSNVVLHIYRSNLFPNLFSKSPVTNAIFVRPFTFDDLSLHCDFGKFCHSYFGRFMPSILTVVSSDKIRDRLLLSLLA